MNSFLLILNWVGFLLLKEKLSHYMPYQGAERDNHAQWAAFKTFYLEALNEEVLGLPDHCNLVAAWERDAAFCLGLQLGLEPGGLDHFWDTEPQGMTLQYGATAQAPLEA